ncbi:hypothetical protein INT47_010402 [Mucor saturninus]|uniref:CCHC-type domain-containing protein n=1 Tax=Mucor saturninus TaxID=64648 RepID=A0A8H7UPR5_9FUNG|nr:hypothetical protein INT47_010402 [Mucor saturninus]
MNCICAILAHNASLSDWNEVTNSAKRIEMNDNKYGEVRQTVEVKPTGRESYQDLLATRASGDAVSVVSLNSIASTVERLCQGFDALQLQINTNGNIVAGSVRSTNHVRIAEPAKGYTPLSERQCYNCQEYGHLSTHCSKPRLPRGSPPNNVRNQQKDKEDEGQEVHLIEAAEVYAAKRVNEGDSITREAVKPKRSRVIGGGERPMPSLQENMPQLPPMSSMQASMPHNMYNPTYPEPTNHTLPPILQGQASSSAPVAMWYLTK